MLAAEAAGSSLSEHCGIVVSWTCLERERGVLEDPCEDEPVWDPAVGSFGVWNPIEADVEQNDGVCLTGDANGVVSFENHAWTAVAAPVVGRGDRMGFGDSYLYISSGFVALPGLLDILVALTGTDCKPVMTRVWQHVTMEDHCTLEEVWGDVWEGLKDLFDIVKGDSGHFPVELLGVPHGSVTQFGVIKHPTAGNDPSDPEARSFPSDLFVTEELRELERAAGVYQFVHMTVPVISVVIDKVSEKAIEGLTEMLSGFDAKLVDRLVSVHDNIKELSAFPEALLPEVELGQWLTSVVDTVIRETIKTMTGSGSALEAIESTAIDIANEHRTELNQYIHEPTADMGQVMAGIFWELTLAVLKKAAPKTVAVIGVIDTGIGIASAVGTVAYGTATQGYDTISFYAAGKPEDPNLNQPVPNQPVPFQSCEDRYPAFPIADMALGDVYGAGNQDMVVVGNRGIKRYKHNGQDGFDEGNILTCDLQGLDSVTIGDIAGGRDLKGDGSPDIIVTRIAASAEAANNYTTQRDVIFFKARRITLSSLPRATTGVSGSLTDVKAYYWYGTETLLRSISSNAPISVAIGDVTGDTKDDLLIGETGSIHLYHSTTEMWITIATGLGDSRISLAIGDVNGDQHIDIVAVEPNNLWVIQSQRDGDFETPLPLGHTPNTIGNLQIVVGDLNMDNLADIVTADQDRTSIYISNTAFFNNPTNTYQPEPLHLTTPGNPQDISIGNMAGDPHPDIITIRRNPDPEDPDPLQILQSHNQNSQQGLCTTSTPLPNGTALAIPKNTTNTIITTNTTTHQTHHPTTTCQTHHPLPNLTQTTTQPTEFTAIAVSPIRSTACGIRVDRTIGCWGRNWYGEASPPEGTFTDVAVGSGNVCALRTNGRIACWGGDYYSPKPEVPEGTFTDIAVGVTHSCAIRANGTIACWDYWEGDPPEGTFTDIAVGAGNVCAIRTNGEIVCWGRSWYGDDRVLETDLLEGSFTDIVTGRDHACAIRTNGTIVCWGDNQHGQLDAPEGTFTDITTTYDYLCALQTSGAIECWGDEDYLIPDPPDGVFTDVATSFSYVCALDTNGGVTCWGGFQYRAGEPDPPEGTFTAITLGYDQACALDTNGKIVCWGQPFYDNIPAGTFNDIELGAFAACALDTNARIACWDYWEPDPPEGTFTDISMSFDFGCGLHTDGSITCWGDSHATELFEVPEGTFTAIAAGGTFGCAIRANGSITCWGGNGVGETDSPEGTFTAITSHNQHSCALDTDGNISCWGTGSLLSNFDPPNGTFTDITTGSYHVCALDTSGKIVCWGYNFAGQLEAPAGTFTAITSYRTYSCALDSKGKIVCWGPPPFFPAPPGVQWYDPEDSLWD